jgi:hypothetical protein
MIIPRTTADIVWSAAGLALGHKYGRID